MSDKKSKAVVIGTLLSVDVGNPNAGWTEGIVTVLKKVERPNGETHPYISGQALRRYLRDTLRELLPESGVNEKMSPILTTEDPKAPIITEGNPREYIDDDLFGFMRAVKGGTKLRESPLRVSPAFGLFPYTGDRDLGTKSALEPISEMIKDEKRNLESLAELLGVKIGNRDIEEVKKEILEKAHRGSMFETEITNNVFRTTLLLELDRVGKWKSYEIVGEEKEGEIQLDNRRRRASLLLKAIKYLRGGGRRTRLLIDMTPRFIIYARMTKKVPIFLNTLAIKFEDNQYKLDIDALDEVVRDYKPDIQKLIIGSRQNFPDNEKELKEWAEEIGAEITSVGEAIDKMQADVKSANF